MSRSTAPAMPSGDVLMVEQIVITTVLVGHSFTIDDIRPQLDRAGISPRAFGPLLHALHRREVIERVDSIHRTKKHGYNSGHRGMWRRRAPVSLRGSLDA